MYLPSNFAAQDPAIAIELIREHGFASLVTNDDDGHPFITHLPLIIDDDAAADAEGIGPTLLGHCAKPNPQWRHLLARPRAVVTFLGPHAYMSPSVYPDLARVPTWNYLAVHATVEATLIESAEGKDALLKRLIGVHEPAYARQWADLGDAFQQQMLGGIVGFALRVTQLQCKVKLNQHRPEAHVCMHEAYAAGSPDERALALWMRRLGLETTRPAAPIDAPSLTGP